MALQLLLAAAIKHGQLLGDFMLKVDVDAFVGKLKTELLAAIRDSQIARIQ